MQDHIFFDQDKLFLLDQRLLPGRNEHVACSTWQDVADAIKKMVVRGAPAIGVAAAWGCVLAAMQLKTANDWPTEFKNSLAQLANARPTAVNLRWAVNRMARQVENCGSLAEALETLKKEAEKIQQEDLAICSQIGAAGAELIKDGDTVLTHCNAGALATAGFGTALGVIRQAVLQGKKVKVIADETRPFFQGSRLTAYELMADNIPVKVICDNAAALLLSRGQIQLVITGADRVAANGDTANKIGTLGVAIAARYFNVPFYIASPLSTFDPAIASGQDIPIEERDASEVATVGGLRLVPDNCEIANFAFDVTPATLIDGIITEKGILRPPYQQSIQACLNQKK